MLSENNKYSYFCLTHHHHTTMICKQDENTRIAVKVGSNVLTRPDGTLDVTRMSALVDQIAALRKQGTEVILISSGAVAAGRSEVHPGGKLSSVEERQLYSAVGQAKLINRYYELFREHGIAVGQVLTTKESFATRRHYLNQRACMDVMLRSGVLPIVNENDTISVTELMFTDNDELSGLIATMMDVDSLIILSNIDGVYTGLPSDPEARLISEVKPDEDLSAYIRREKSGLGRGGMSTKTRIARKVASEGIAVWIANGKREHILTDLLSRASIPCTRFIPSPAATSSIKKWIAHSNDFCKGEIQINEETTHRLTEGQVASILPLGIVRLEGDFEEDDLVYITGYDGRRIGIGKADCDAGTVRAEMGCRGKKAVVHYDFLYIEKTS